MVSLTGTNSSEIVTWNRAIGNYYVAAAGAMSMMISSNSCASSLIKWCRTGDEQNVPGSKSNVIALEACVRRHGACARGERSVRARFAHQCWRYDKPTRLDQQFHGNSGVLSAAGTRQCSIRFGMSMKISGRGTPLLFINQRRPNILFQWLAEVGIKWRYRLRMRFLLKSDTYKTCPATRGAYRVC